MTVPTTSSYTGPLFGDGTTTDFDFAFRAMDEDEIAVMVDGTTVSTSTYSVAIADDGISGTVSFLVAPTAGVEIIIYSNPLLTQTTTFEDAGSYLPSAHDRALDRAAIRDIALRRDTSRALKLPFGMNFTFPYEAADRADLIFGFDSDGDPTVLPQPQGDKGDPGGNISSIGTFAQAPTLTIDAGTALVQVSGTDADGDTGSGRKFVEAAEVDAAFVSANPLIAFRDAAGRGFREVHPVTGEKIVPFLLIIAGQSNAVGSNSGGPNPASPGVKTWNGSTGAWGGSDYTAAPWTLSSPHGNGGNNNYALAAAHRIYLETRRPVYIVYDAVGGTSIDAWVAAGTASVRYAALKAKVAAALATTAMTTHGKTAADGMVWSQGEEDGGDSFATHMANLATLNAQLRAESWMDDYTPIFATGMSDLHDRYEVSAALRHYAAKVGPGWRYISTKGMPTSDATHFTGPALWEVGYNRIGPALVNGETFGEEIEPSAFYARGAGRLSQDSGTAIAVFDNLVSWGSRTDGPGVTDTYTGDGATTAYTLTSRGGITSVTVAGVAKTNPADYTVSGTTLTFAVAPGVGAAIVVSYSAAINGPAAVGSISWGHRCYADGNYTMAGGYLTYTSLACNYTLLWGRSVEASDGADYSAGFGFQNSLTNFYQFVAGRGHTAAAVGEAILGTYSKYQDGSRLFQVGSGPSSGFPRNSIGVNATEGNVELYCPSTAVDPGQNSELTFKLTSNTNLQIRVRGTDGTVRSGNITLA